MTNTDHKYQLAAAFPVDQAEAIHDAITGDDDDGYEPVGARFFDTDRVTHTHDNSDGEQWHVVITSAPEAFIELLGDLAPNFPDARFAVVGEIKGYNGQPHFWRAGGVCMAKDEEALADVLDGLERIETEGDL